ncbi:MET5 [Candida oxycetoniae]|uniref:Sulfite reductase [NADPH] subunit beta n=1 Tax=Candida oxycetoniae TaxID=497107 RepID=A0AAI9T1H8_9ASCO|nr:MET5 [Candida oxycetoniae]KAI3406315.2 MET5 [Candida oxycetoniae]
MSLSQEEIIAKTIGIIDGILFVTQPAKSVNSLFTKFVKDANILLDANDPYAVVQNYLADRNNKNKELDLDLDLDFVTVTTNSCTLFKNLPFLSSSAFKNNKVVNHVEIVNSEFNIVTSLRDLQFPVLISQNPQEAYRLANLAYNLSQKLKTSVFHFYSPNSSYNAKQQSKFAEGVLLKDLDNLSLEKIIRDFEVEPFEIVNQKQQQKQKQKNAILYLGQLSDELIDAANKENVLLISIKIYQPFHLNRLLELIPAQIETLSIVEQSSTPFFNFSPLLLDFFASYYRYQSLKNFTRIVSATFGNDIDYPKALSHLVSNIESENPVQNLHFGNNLSETSALEDRKRDQEYSNALSEAYNLEQAYLKVLQQVSGSNLNILNAYNTENVGLETNPEFGFGSYLHDEEEQENLIKLVRNALKENKFESQDNSRLINLLSSWLSTLEQRGQVEHATSLEIIDLLKSDKSSVSARELLALSKYFSTQSNWLIGSDAWSYDLGSSGVHNVITSNKNINMLIIDSEPYQEKKNNDKTVNGFRKKDVGLYAMNHGDCYVASVAVYSSYTQVLQAFIEAEKFTGPSIVLAYLPYHKESDNTLSILQETKRAVDNGYWPLYRYDPYAANEEDVFKLDSSNLRKQLQDFLEQENRLTMLARKDPLLSRNLTNNASSEVKAKQAQIADEAYALLLQGLSGPPLTVAYASDGGNAEGLAKKINRQALGRGLKSVVLQMDDVSIEDLPNETNIIFVTSTSGQGEFPTNGKQFWDAIKNSNDLDLSSIKFSVFGLGDSQYWPRKEDKHYYNKPGKDLFGKLKLYGGVELAELGLGDDQDADGFSTGFDEWILKIWTALGVDNVEGVEEPKPITNEDMKLGSDYLRGTIAEALQDQSTGSIGAVDQQLTKFHGIYMQDDRDLREERKAQGLEPAYAFMVRVRLPGGVATPKQYLKMDELADERGNGTLKLTTRATFQLHGVVKHDLKPAIRGMNATLMDTLAACGDVNRNVMVSALPSNAKIHGQVSAIGTLISNFLLPNTTAYHEIWLEGELPSDKPGDRDAWENRKDGPQKKKTLIAGNVLADVEPQYGATYLPRKFKIVITVPPYNDVDVYAHDIGLIAIVKDNEVIGFNVLAGGGMGTTHNNKKTYPRTGSMLGYIKRDLVHFACEKIMLVQKEFGDRTNRKHARLKYTIDDLGVDVFKAKVEDLLGTQFEEPKPFKIENNVDHFGWCKDELGYNHFTAFIENGRIEDTPELPQKTGLRKIAQFLQDNKKSGEFRLTGNQHLLISNIKDCDLEEIKKLLAEYKLDNTKFSGLRLSSAACVAFPTCGLAMAESERYLPQLITKLEERLEGYGLRHDSIVMRMTGCPNGCSRPWVAEVALVGKAFGAYNLMLGGGHHGQRLNKIYRYSIKEDEILEILSRLFERWSKERNDGEPFGDWCIRAGVIKETTEGKYFHDDIPEDA